MNEKKRFKMPSSYTVLFSIIVFISLLTWIIPSGQFEQRENMATGRLESVPGTYRRVEQTPQGLWEIAMAPVSGMLGTSTTNNEGMVIETPGAIEVGLFIIIIGGFLGVVQKTGAIDVGIAELIRKNKGNEKRLIPILMTLFALGGTTYGMAEETMAFYALLIPVMIAAGFDSIVAVGVILGGAMIGVLGSTVNPFSTGVASQSVGLSPGDGIVWRLIILVLSLIVGIWWVYRYASKVEKDQSNSLVDDYEADKLHFAIDEHALNATLTKSQKVSLFLFGLTFVIMVISLVPWDMLNPNWTFFVTLSEGIQSIPILGDVYGTGALPLGWWFFREITMLFMVMAIIIGKLAGMKEDSLIASFMMGANDLLGVALIVGLARGIQVVMNDGQMTATVLEFGSHIMEGIPHGIFGFLTLLFYMPMSFLIPSTSGLASATMSIMGPLGESVGVHASVVITAFQSATGLVGLLTPTSAVTMGALAIARVGYGKWFKFIFPLWVMLFFISAIVITIASFLSTV